MIMRVVVGTSKAFFRSIIESTPKRGIFYIFLRLVSIIVLLLTLIPLTQNSLFLYFRENCIWWLSNYVWRSLLFSFLFLLDGNSHFLWNWCFYFWASFLAFGRTSRSFSANTFRTSILVYKTRNALFRNLELKFQELRRVEQISIQMGRWFSHAFSVFLTFHEFKILI